MVNYVRPSGAPPGPKPKIYGPDIIWDPRIHHWVKPKDIYDVVTMQHVKIPARHSQTGTDQEGYMLDDDQKDRIQVNLGDGQLVWIDVDKLEAAYEKEENSRQSTQDKPIDWPDAHLDWSEPIASHIFKNKRTITARELGAITNINNKKLGDGRDLPNAVMASYYSQDPLEAAAGKYISSADNLNLAMRIGDLDMFDGYYRQTVEILISAMKPLEVPQTLFRGVNYDIRNSHLRPAKPGDVLPVDSFLSTSRSAFVGASDWFASEDEDRSSDFLEIQTTSNSQGLPITDVTGRFDEEETLLAPGQYLEVQEVIDDMVIKNLKRRYLRMKLHNVDRL